MECNKAFLGVLSNPHLLNHLGQRGWSVNGWDVYLITYYGSHWPDGVCYILRPLLPLFKWLGGFFIKSYVMYMIDSYRNPRNMTHVSSSLPICGQYREEDWYCNRRSWLQRKESQAPGTSHSVSDYKGELDLLFASSCFG